MSVVGRIPFKGCRFSVMLTAAFVVGIYLLLLSHNNDAYSHQGKPAAPPTDPLQSQDKSPGAIKVTSVNNKGTNGVQKPQPAMASNEDVKDNGAWIQTPDNPVDYHVDSALMGKATEERLLKGKNVLDLGAGSGAYGRLFLRKAATSDPASASSSVVHDMFIRRIMEAKLKDWWMSTPQQVTSWTGFDGAENVEDITGGLVKSMDLSKDQSFDGRQWDWVLSLEVGEHIPKQFESTFISNVVKPAKEGIVLSWAVRGQGGRAHVNNLDNDEVVERMLQKGFVPDLPSTCALRQAATISWFKNTVMVYRRRNIDDGTHHGQAPVH